ncbi:hypothetical protein LTR85_001348 [Meristemomyces frigidus]|nr:hypothetical protein LTR85_001348 [Meristemomyces frigidus]
MPAPTFTTRPISAVAPRVELDADETDFDLGYDPSTFETKHSRPTTADGKHSPDSPTLGAHSSPILPGDSTAAVDFGAERHSRFVEEMASPFNETISALAGASSSASSQAQSMMGGGVQSHVVNPATIPIRTSSSNAVASGEKEREREKRYSTGNGNSSGSGSGSGMPTSPRKSPKKHRSLGSVPEERRYSQRTSTHPHPDERGWLAQGQRHPHANGNGDGHASSSRSESGSRALNTYPSTTFSQQATLSPVRSASSMRTDEPLARHPANRSPPTDLTTPTDHPSTTWTPEKENILKGPFDYLEAHPGKDIRAQLITAFNAWLRVPPASLAIITSIIGMLHTASLLIDDVEDSSTLRRGVPAAHKIFGEAQTINSANYVYFCALQELLKLPSAHQPGANGAGGVVAVYAEELLNLHRGQGMDLFWRDTLTCPSEDDYLEMVGNKTGGLFRLAIKLMCAESPSHNNNGRRRSEEEGDGLPNSGPHDPDGLLQTSSTAHSHQQRSEEKTDYIPLANTIGLLFQILDDYRNLSDSSYTANKGLCEDLTEGKFSFPVIHSIRADPRDLTIINVLRQKTRDEEVKRFAVGYMEGRTGSFAYTRRVLRGLTKRALGLVGEVEGSVGARGLGEEGEGGGGGDGVRAILEKMRVERHERGSQSV